MHMILGAVFTLRLFWPAMNLYFGRYKTCIISQDTQKGKVSKKLRSSVREVGRCYDQVGETAS